MNKLLLFLVFIFIVASNIKAQDKTDAHIIGHVTANNEHLPFATILIEGTTIGTATDETGHFQILNLEPGSYSVKAQAIGYKSQTKEIVLKLNNTVEVKFNLTEDLIGIEQVVISGNRNEQNRHEAMTIVNTISPKLFESTQSTSFGEALNFAPGLRVENNCQNCGFTQVRMNGMEGPYSQILINNRPIFSGLAGVYGLELYPANMIERVEVVRGGGSALYGSNAIAGTINLITKDPLKSGFELNTNSSAIGIGVKGSGDPALDNTISFNGSVIDHEAKAGVTVFGFVRDRDAFDANGDSFTEISEINNTTVGTRAFHRTGNRGKITVDYFNIREKRRGGNKLDATMHDADIAEGIEHNINTGAIAFDQLFGSDKLSVFGSVQHVDRGTYYGAKEHVGGEPDLTAYGQTYDLSYSTGTQLYLNRERLLFAPGNLVAGIENNGGYLEDTKLGYFDYAANEVVNNRLIADQTTNTTGLFAQAEWEWNKIKVSIGARVDHFIISNKEHVGEDVTGTVFSPRVSFKYEIVNNVQIRGSYSEGYRAPQIFDEDLHIEVSGSRKVEHYNDPDLKEEKSKSLMASLDISAPIGFIQSQFLLEGFYTKLTDPFISSPDSVNNEGTTIYIRSNSDGAYVAGVNMEWNLAFTSDFTFRTGFTYQLSKYDTQQSDFNEKEFYRTPNAYGFLVLDYDFIENLCLSVSGNYTGSMKVPFYGIELTDSESGELRESESFVDLGLKLAYDIKLNGTTLQLNGGVKNIINAYQSDFDQGIYRDPGYMYGPGLPRTIYLGIRFSNF